MSTLNLNHMKENEFNNHLLSELYSSLTKYRDMFKLPKLYQDDGAENAVKDYLMPEIRQNNTLDAILKEKEFCGKITANFEIKKNYPPKNNEINNNVKFTNFMRFFEEQFAAGKCPLTNQDCSTHVGIGFSADSDHNYTISAVLSQKGISIECAQALKDGVVIQGQMLQPNSYLFGVLLSKNKRVPPLVAGPSKINFDKNSGKFNVILNSKQFGSQVALGMRKVYFHCKQTNNPYEIPYLDASCDDKQYAWGNYEVLLVQTINFLKVNENRKELIEKFLKPFEDNNAANKNNNNNINNNNMNVQQQGNNLNNLIGDENISPINQNINNNLTGNQNLNNNNNNPNQTSNFRNNLSHVLSSTNSKNPTNSFFNPNFMNNKKTGNTGMKMFGPIQEENSFMLGSVCNSNLNSLRKLNNNLVHLSNSKNNQLINNNNLNNPITPIQAMNNANNNNNSNLNLNTLQNNIKSINMSSLNNFNLNHNNHNNSLHSNAQNNNNNNNLVKNNLNQNQFNSVNLNNNNNNNHFNNVNSNSMIMNSNLNMNQNNLNPMNNFNSNGISINSLNQNFPANNLNNNNNNTNNNFNLNQNQFFPMNNNTQQQQQQQNFNQANNQNKPNSMQLQMQIQPNSNNMNMDILNNQRQNNGLINNNNNNNPFPTNNFSFNNNNSNSMNHPQNLMNCNNLMQNNPQQQSNKNYNTINKSPLDHLFLQVTHYENLFRNEKQIIKACNIPLNRFGPNATVSEMLNSLTNPQDDVMHIPIKSTLAAGHKKFVTFLDPFKKHDFNNNLVVRAKSRTEFADFVQSKINEKKYRIINNANNNVVENHNLNHENERNSLINNNNNHPNRINPFNLYDKGNNNLNSSIQIQQQQMNYRFSENDSINKIQAGNNNFNPTANYNNNINMNQGYMENQSARMFNNAHPNLLKSSVKFYQRDRNAIEDYYANSSLDHLYNSDCNPNQNINNNINNNNIFFPYRENERANLNNLHNPNKPNSNNLINNINNNNNKKFTINKEEYQKLSKSLFTNDSSNNNINLNPNINKNLNTNNNINNIKNNTKEATNNNINIEKLEKEYLLESDLKSEANPVFLHFYKMQSDYDLVLDINGERINAHKIVVLSQCNAIKTITGLDQNSNLNRSNFNEPFFIPLNKKFKKEIFNEILIWLYCRKISKEISKDVSALREMLIIAHELEIFDLQRILIIKHIIPCISKECCLRLLKDSHNKNVQREVKEVWKILGLYAQNATAKIFSYLLKNARSQILGMETDLLFTVIEEAIYYASEFSEVQNIIQLVIESGFAADVFELLGNLSKYYENARNFHIQNIDLKAVLERFDFFKPIELPLLSDMKIMVEKLKDFKAGEDCSNNVANASANVNAHANKNSDLVPDKNINNQIDININNLNNNNNAFLKSKSNNFNVTSAALNPNNINNININANNLELAKSKNEFSGLLNNFKTDKSNCPSNNKVNLSHENLRKKNPSFIFKLNLSEDLIESCSIISDVFITRSNSWQLKIDIQKDTGEVSVFLLDRGLTGLPHKHLSELKKKNTVKFNSVLFDVEVKDNSFEKSFVMFFSYLLNQNQIIGFENFFNLNQLDKKEQIYIKIWVKEYALHSACLQYVSNNFQNLANNLNNSYNNHDENKQIKLNNILNNEKLNKNISQVNLNLSDKNALNNNNNNNNNNNLNNNFTLNRTLNNSSEAIRSLFDVSLGDLACILFNDFLNVENENFVMSFVYKYCLKRSAKEIEALMNSIRYKFVDFRMLCIIARDHKVISKSLVYRKFFDYELKFRLGKRIHYAVIDERIQIENSAIMNLNKKSQSLGGLDNYININLPKQLNSEKNPFDYTKDKQNAYLCDNDKQHFLFSDIKDSAILNNISNENQKIIIPENTQLNQNDFLNINLRNIEYIQSKERNFYKSFNSDHPIEAELENFFFESNHHSCYEEEIERLKKLVEENAKAKEREIKMLQNQKKELEVELQKINEREIRKRRALNNNNNNNSSLNLLAPALNKDQNQEPKCIIF